MPTETLFTQVHDLNCKVEQLLLAAERDKDVMDMLEDCVLMLGDVCCGYQRPWEKAVDSPDAKVPSDKLAKRLKIILDACDKIQKL